MYQPFFVSTTEAGDTEIQHSCCHSRYACERSPRHTAELRLRILEHSHLRLWLVKLYMIQELTGTTADDAAHSSDHSSSRTVVR